MPWVEDAPLPFDYLTGSTRPAAPAAAPDPTLGDTVGAAFRQANILVSGAANFTMRVDNDYGDPNYNAWSDISGTKYEPYWEQFAASNNPEYTNALKRQIDMEEQDRQTLAASGWAGTFAGFGAALVDPTMLIPGIGIAGKAGKGYSLTRAALAGSTSAAVAVGVQEAGLQATQATRPLSESAVNIGFGAIFGGLVGAGVHHLMTPKELSAAQRGFDALFDVARGAETRLSAEQIAKRTGITSEIDTLQKQLDSFTGGVHPRDAIAEDIAASIDMRDFHLEQAQKFTKAADELAAKVGEDNSTFELFRRQAAEQQAKADGHIENIAARQKELDALPDPQAIQTRIDELKSNLAEFDRTAATEVPRAPAPDPAVVAERQRLEAEQQTLTKAVQDAEETLTKTDALPEEKAAAQAQIDSLKERVAAIDTELQSVKFSEQAPTSAGAQAVNRATTMEDFQIAGGWLTRKLAKGMSFLSPNARSMFRASPVFRDIYGKVAAVSSYLTGHEAGRATAAGGAAETEFNVLLRSSLGSAVKEGNALYKAMKKAGINMSRGDFYDAIGRAMRNGDVNAGNTYVSQAAQVWRTKVFEPLKDAAIPLNLLPEDVSVDTAVSYFSRMYNKDMLIAREGEFKTRVIRNWLEPKLREEFLADRARTRATIARLDQRIADLKLSEADRTIALNQLKAEGERIDALNSNYVDIRSKINDLRNVTIKPIKEANPEGWELDPVVIAAQNEIKRLQDFGGDGYKAFLKQRGEIRSRYRNIDFNIAGMEARQREAFGKLADLEEQQKRSLESLLKRGQVFERITQKWDEAKFEAHKAALRDAFDTEIRKADKSYEAAQARLEKLRKAQDDRRVKLREQEDKFYAEERAASKKDPSKHPGAGKERIEALRKAVEAEKKQAQLEIDTQQKILDIQEAAAETQKNYAQKINSLRERLENADNTDPQAFIDAAKEMNADIVSRVKDTTLARGERAQRILDRVKNYDPERVKRTIAELEARKEKTVAAFDERGWKRSMGEGGSAELHSDEVPDFTVGAKEVMDEIFEKISGRGQIGNTEVLPDFIVPFTKGPLKDRTFNVPDALIEDFLHSDVREVGARYARNMAGEITLARRFGKPSMIDQIDQIKADYGSIRAKVMDATTEEQVLAAVNSDPNTAANFKAWLKQNGDVGVTKERALTWLNHDQEDALRDLTAVRDMIRGTYKLAENNTGLAKWVRRLNAFNYVRLSGGFLISSMADMYGAAFSHGLSPFFSGLIKPLLTNLDGLKLAADEAKMAGLISERVLQHRLFSLAEIGDPFASGAPIDRLLANGSALASKWNGMAMWQDINEAMASILTMNRIAKGVRDGGDDRFLSMLGLGEFERQEIAKFLARHGDEVDGVSVANTNRWTEGLSGKALADAEYAVQAYRNAVQKYTTMTVPLPGFGDLPLFARTPLGKAVLQFRTFSIAAHQRTTMRALQEGPRQVVAGMVGTASIGMLVSWLGALRGGDKAYERWRAQAENPGWLITEGLDRGGFFPAMFELANTVEKLTTAMGAPIYQNADGQDVRVFNPIKSPAAMLFGGGAYGAESSRNMNRSLLSSIGGPTLGILDSAAKVGGGVAALLAGDTPTTGQLKQGAALLPYSSFVGIKEALQLLIGDSPYVQ